MPNTIPVWIYSPTGEDDAATRLAHQLQLPVASKPLADIALVLTTDRSGLLRIGFTSEVIDAGDIDRDSPAWFTPGFKSRFRAAGRDPLLRAIGYRTTSVVDCTAGWAVDATHIASHGIVVDATERHPVVAALLLNACRPGKARVSPVQLRIHHADSAEFIENLSKDPEVIYIDPMYPSKPGSAAPRRPLQLLQALHQATIDDDAAPLLHLARQRAARRVVVKRPHHAEPLAAGASGAIDGKLVRFDLYPPL